MASAKVEMGAGVGKERAKGSEGGVGKEVGDAEQAARAIKVTVIINMHSDLGLIS